ncbi:exopolysaccharide biosynthesis protein [uncultured Cohaesibacter sp.]|uniref:exopolysaccharide biosynthesis protein n=1 Tax=uncultured Cohaesibacter sp. TaxID=1002546 RepID=UPI002AAAA85D|nr:exopolysaccharide biosynthesis protein [uncultured Cohaesibacter sp.]
MSENALISEILDTIEEKADSKAKFTVGDLLDAFGRRAHGPAIAIVGLVSASPIGAIPGASIFLGLLCLILAGQYALKDSPPSLPKPIQVGGVDGKRLASAIEKARPYVGKLSFLFSERLTFMTQSPWAILTAILIAAFALSMVPLALVPGGVFIPSIALAIIGFAVAARDGLMLIVASAIGAVASAMFWFT